MLLSIQSIKAINVAIKSKRSFWGLTLLFVFRYKQQNCEVKQFENSCFELECVPAHHDLKTQLGMIREGGTSRKGDQHLSLPLAEKQVWCNNIRRVEGREHSW